SAKRRPSAVVMRRAPGWRGRIGMPFQILKLRGGLERLAQQLRHDLTRRFLAHRGQFLRCREHVVVQIEGCPHAFSITHHASDVMPAHPADAVLWLPTAEHRWPNAKRPACSTTSTPAV